MALLKTRFHRFRHQERRTPGQAMVEFALLLVVLLLFIFVIIEAGRMLQSWLTVQNAARAGGRYAITGQFDPSCLSDTPACADPRVESIRDEARGSTAGLVVDYEATFGEVNSLIVQVAGVDEDGVWQDEYAGLSGKPVMVRVVYRMPIIVPLLKPIAESVQVVGQVILNNENFNQYDNSQTDNTPPNLPPPPTLGPPQSDLAITKTGAPPVVLINEPLVYSLQVTNNGPSQANGVTVVDTLPPGVTFVSASPPEAGCSESGGVVTCYLGSLAYGQVFNFTINVNAPGTAGPITNTAIVSSGSVDPEPSNDTATATNQVVATADNADMRLVNKVDIPDPVIVNQQLDYIIDIVNNGIGTATGVVVTDPLPTGTTLVSASSTQGTCSGTTTVTCDIGSLGNGIGATITIRVTAPPDPGTMTNTAEVTADQNDPDPFNNSYSQTTTINPESADLFVTKADNPDPAPVGENLIYVLQVGNNGPAVATGVTLVDTLPPSVTFISATPTAGVVCNHSAGVVTCNVPDLPPSTGAQIVLTVQPNQTGTISNEAVVSGTLTDDYTLNNTAVAITTITPTSDLYVTKTANPTSPPGVPAGEPLVYTIVVGNNGPSAATGVQMIDTLPVDVSFVSATTTQGSCSPTGITVVCQIGSLAVNGTATIVIEVVPTIANSITNRAQVSGNNFDSNPVNNVATAFTTVTAPSSAFIVVEPVCGSAGASATVYGYNWPATGNQIVYVYWDSIGGPLLGNLVNGTLWQMNITIPAGATNGVHTILAVRQNTERTTAFTVPCPAPDLTITNLTNTTPGPIQTGDPVTFTASINNIGSLAALSQFPVSLYFDPPPPNPGDTHISSDYRRSIVVMNGLNVGQSALITFVVPAGFLTSGNHQVYAVVDSDPGPYGNISELSETNNITGPVTVSVAAGPTPTATPTVDPSATATPTPAPTGSLVGQAFVVTPGGSTLPQANVEVRVFLDGNQVGASVFTDEFGTYQFPALPPGSYTVYGCVNIAGIQYSISVTPVSIVSGNVTILDLYLVQGICP
jgi:uncharacterized repeat protein (TIGR01451 family)